MTFYVFLSCLTRFLEHWMQVEKCTAAAVVSAVVRGASAGLRRTSLIYWHQLLSDIHQSSLPRAHQHTSASTQPLRWLIPPCCTLYIYLLTYSET